MKITKIEPFVVGAPTPGNGKLSDKNYIFVRVHTDEGITGLGEASLGGYTQTIIELVTTLAEMLVGEDPTRIEYLLQCMTRQKFWRGGVVKGSAIAGIELALWDILGKSLGVPVHKLFGGPCRDKIRVYANGWTGGSVDPAEVRDRADEVLAAGYDAFKFSIAHPSWPVYDPSVTRTVVRVAETIREKIGPERLLMFDGHGRYDADSAIAIGNALKDLDLLFFEEPVGQVDERAMARVNRNIPMPVAAGERLESKWEFRRLLELEAASILQPDLAHCNGFSEAYKIAALADAFSAFMAPHCPMSPVLAVISAHFDAAVPNFLIQERLFLNDWRNDIITEPLVVKDGFIDLPTKPGWGIELNEEMCGKHDRIKVRIPRLFRPDGAVCDWWANTGHPERTMSQTFPSHNLPGRNKIGQLRLVPANEIKQSGVSIGFECLDRFMFDPEKCYDRLAAIGVKWARCQTGWCRCEKEKGVYDFAWLDEVVDNLLERGIQPWFNVGYGNRLYMPDAYGEAAVGHVPLYYGEETLQAWKNYIRALAEHFASRVTLWEIWNEPNIKAFWQPREADPLEYARLIRLTAPIIREAIADARIGACTACVFDPSYTAAFARSGIGSDLDVFSYHLYSLQPELNSFYSELAALRRVFDENGGQHVRIHQGEAGYASWFPGNHWMHPYVLESQENQAKCLLRRYLTDFAAGLEMSSFFQMADMVKPYQKGADELKRPARHGILDGDTYEPKMSYYALAHIASLFDCDTTLSPFFIRVSCDREMPKTERISRLFNVSLVTHSFLRNGRPLYFYYLPEDVQFAWPGMEKLDISLFPTEHNTGISRPVVVDMLDGAVYRHQDFAVAGEYVSTLRNMPIRDYPLLLTDISALEGRLEV